jgi:hypothetical protein
MALRKRTPVHYVSLSFHGGASYSATPDRKPNKRDCLAQDDADSVNLEYFSGKEQYEKFLDDTRRHVSGILATRINTRRAIRDLVLPELEAIKNSLAELHAKLDRLQSSQG